MFRSLLLAAALGVSFILSAQTYDDRPIKGNYGALQESDSWVDAQEYSVITFQFQYRTTIVVFLDPNQKELARHQMNASGLTFFGYTSNEREFIVYFTGRVDGKNKNKLYFLYFFKTEGKAPIFTEWLDFPLADDALFSYSYNDKLCFIDVDSENNSLQLTEFSTINVKTQILFSLSEEAADMMKKQSFAINSETPQKKTLNKANLYQSDIFVTDFTSKALVSADTLQFIMLKDGRMLSRETKKLFTTTLSRKTGTVTEKEYDFEFGKNATYDIVNNRLFVLTTAPALEENYVDLEVIDFKTMTSLKKYHFGAGADTILFKRGPLVNLESGEVYNKFKDDAATNTKRLIKLMQSGDISARVDWKGNYQLQLRTSIQTGSVPGGSNPYARTAIFTPFAFPGCLDKDLNPCSNTEENLYFKAFMDFGNLPIKKNSSAKLFFVYSPTKMISYFYNAKLKQYSITSRPKQ